jgi:ComF family protein
MIPLHFQKARSVVRYGPVARSLVHQLKYGDRLEIAALLGRMMCHTGRELFKLSDIIVPMPLHPWRLWTRRFNQAALLASTVSQISGLPWHGNICTRIKNTPSQIYLKRAQREKNLKQAFALQNTHSGKIKNRRVLIIDDVFTTGASVNSLSETLKKAGAETVNVLTFARVLIHDEMVS